MGGAIAVHTAVANHVPSLLGLCVIDVVEGNTVQTFKIFSLCLFIWYYGFCYYCFEVLQWMLWTACRTSSEVGQGLLSLWRMLLSGGKHEVWLNALFTEQRRISCENISPSLVLPVWRAAKYETLSQHGCQWEVRWKSRSHWFFSVHEAPLLYTTKNFTLSDISRCEESPSSPGVSNSIGEGIIEEDEDEEGEEESNKKKMKEDDQEVLSVPVFAWLCVLNNNDNWTFCNSDEETKPLYLASRAVKDRKVLGGLVPRPLFTFSHLSCAKAASACRWNLSFTAKAFSIIKKSETTASYFDCCTADHTVSSLIWSHCAGVDRLDKDLTIGQMQGTKAWFHI